ncbi:hypothetical protein J6Q66_01990 [bacterium]|nr:hypothetical protein [bacterium]
MQINRIQQNSQRINFASGFKKVPQDLRLELLQDQSNNVFKNIGIATFAGLVTGSTSALYFAHKKVPITKLSKKSSAIGLGTAFLAYLITLIKDSQARTQKIKNYYANSKN